jgi:ribonuclease HI
LERTPNNAKIFELLQRADNWIRTHQTQNPILRWDTDNWGEIPADFGRK